MRTTTDFLIIGGGIIGICIARSLKARHADATVTLIEKETALAAHASGRNSGVLHAGFYYASDSLKAKFARVGNRTLTEYCIEKNLPIRRCGKLVVTQTEGELDELKRLYSQGIANGVELSLVDEAEARRIEPRALTVGQAIFSPTTSSVDPVQVVDSLAADAQAEGVAIERGVAYRGRAGDEVVTSAGKIAAGHVVNAAGLYADRIALDYGFSRHHRILPFRGLYLYGDESAPPLSVHVYPVPDKRYPFLGVHFTVTVDGHVKIGPTALPALWREQYGCLDGFNAGEVVDVGVRLAGLMMGSTIDLRRLAMAEMKKSNRTYLVSLASRLITDVSPNQFRTWGRTGIRAQLVDTRTGKLETDFVIEGDSKSTHLLNAVSPGFTCAIPIGDHVAGLV